MFPDAALKVFLVADVQARAQRRCKQLIENGIPVGRVNRREDLLDDPQIQAAGILRSVTHPRGGEMLQPRAAVRFSETQHLDNTPSADLGEHTVEILSDLGLTFAQMQALAKQGVIA